MQKVIRCVKENKQASMIIGITFMIALLYNMLTPYTTDDYAYMFSAVTGERITNVFQIFPSLWDDYLHIHGRVVPHFFVQLFTIGPKWIFNVVNAAMLTCMFWLMQSMGEEKKNFDLLIWIAIPVVLWVYLPAYGQVFLWFSGSVNYCWAFVFSLVFIRFYVKLYRNPEKILKRKHMVALCAYGLFFGAYSELVSFPTVFVSFLLLCLVVVEKREIKKYWNYVIPVMTAAVGYLTMLLSPSQVSRQASDVSLGAIVKRFIDVFETYYQVSRLLLIIWAVFLVLAACYEVNKKQIIVSGAFLMISLLSMALLSVTSYAVARHYAINVFFLIVAIVILVKALLSKGNVKCVGYCICAYVLMNSVWSLWEGTYDIFSVYQQQCEREVYIEEMKAIGNDDVVYVPIITCQTKYSCKYELLDMQVDDTDVWPNSAIAKYYGIGKIYGIK